MMVSRENHDGWLARFRSLDLQVGDLIVCKRFTMPWSHPDDDKIQSAFMYIGEGPDVEHAGVFGTRPQFAAPNGEVIDFAYMTVVWIPIKAVKQ